MTQIPSRIAQVVEHRTSNARTVGSSQGFSGSNSLTQDQNGEVAKDVLAKKRYLAHKQDQDNQMLSKY